MSQQLYDQNGNPVKKKKKKIWLWVLIGLFAIGLLSDAISSSSGKDNEPKQTTKPSAVVSDESNTEKSETPTTEATTVAPTEPVSNRVPLGEPGGDDEIQIVVSGVTETKEIADGMFKYSPDSGKYAIVEVTISNIGKSSISFMNSNFKLYAGDDIRYSGTTLITSSGDYFSIESINPGLSKTGYLVFNIPDDLDVTEMSMTYTAFNLFAKNVEFDLK